MTVRWDDLPPKMKAQAQAKKPRKRKPPGRWRCVGVAGCGEIVEGSEQALERHLDAHGGHRAECIIEPRGSA